MKGKSIKSRRPKDQKQKSKTTQASLVLLMVVSLLFGFQNCADPLELANEDNASFNKKLPFAFDTAVDTLSYMSCSGVDTGYQQRAYYTFRVGAYEEGSGVRFTEDYLSATANYAPSQRAEAISQSSQNAGAVLQLSIREYGHYDVLQGGGGSKDGEDYNNLLAPLDSPVISEQIAGLAEGQRVNYFSGIPGLDNRRLEGSIRFMKNESLAKDIRDKLEASSIVALTYGDVDGSDVRIAKGPDPAKSVYGTGFRVSFGYGHALATGAPTTAYQTGAIRRVPRNLTETNLLTGRTEMSQWSCPYTFMIVRPQDLGTSYGLGQAFCNTSAENPASTDPAYLAIRSVLRLEDWHVDLTRKCVVPKQSGGVCYGKDNALVNYYGSLGSAGSNCGADSQGNYTRSVVNGSTYDVMCPHYVTVCIRTQ